MNEAKFESQLNRFLQILRKERKALVNNQPEKLEELVDQKATFVSVFDDYQGSISDKMKDLIVAIQRQQEENLLLTKQAISYQSMLMDAVKDTMKTSTQTTYAKTYSAAKQAPTTMINTQI